MGATGLTQGLKNWSMFKIELLAVCWALNHARYYCINALKIIIRTDHSPLKGLFKEDLSEIDNLRVIKLLENTLHYNIEVQTVAGKDNAAADALSRMGCEDCVAPDISRNFFSTRETKLNKLRVKKVGGTRNTPLDLQIIAEEAQTSKTYKELLEAIREGKSQQELPNNHPGKEFSQNEYNKLHIFQTRRGSLVYLDEKLVPPVEARKKLLSKLHKSHSHKQMSWETAKKIWFWKSMKNEINQANLSCGRCIEFSRSKFAQKPILPIELCDFNPGKLLSMDLFEVN